MTNHGHILNAFPLRVFLGQYPQIFYPLYNLVPVNRRLSVRNDTDIVIEGFPRSANTFAVLAFTSSQKSSVKISHHMHVPAQIIKAAKLKIPALVVIRNPKDSAISYVIRKPELSLRTILNCYTSYHKAIYPYRRDYVLATFEEVITEFSKSIRRVNDKFGVDFIPHTPSGVDLEDIFKRADRLEGGDQAKTARPSQERAALKQVLKQEILNPKLEESLKSAELVYEKFLGDLA